MGQRAFVNNKVVAMQRQLLGAEQTAAAQQQTHIACCKLCRVVNPAHSMPPLPQRLDQLWQVALEPAAAIAEKGDAAGRQRQRFTGRDWRGGTGEMDSRTKPARLKQALLA